MKAWGTGTFENDEALDLVSQLMDSPNATLLLKETLRAAAAPAADATQAAAGLAAADVVAAGRGRPGLDMPDEVREMFALYLVHIDDEAVQLAVDAVDATRGTSTLRAYWQDAGLCQEWDGVLATLDSRLKELTAR